jgi:hypothetical protein
MTQKLIYTLLILIGWPVACFFMILYGTVVVIGSVLKVWMD